MRLRLGGRSDKKENRHSVLDTEFPALGWDWAPSPDWGGWDGEFPVRGGFCRHSEQRSMIQNPLQPLPMRHTGLDPVSPANQKVVKLISPLTSVQTMPPDQLCIQAHSSSLCCSSSLCKVQSDNFTIFIFSNKTLF